MIDKSIRQYYENGKDVKKLGFLEGAGTIAGEAGKNYYHHMFLQKKIQYLKE